MSRRGPASTWSYDQTEDLFDMISEGMSFGAIAKVIGRPRCTVIGKFHRLRLGMGVQAV